MTKPHLSKKCASCGLEKPLSTFRILSQAEGSAQYGNICANCRKTQAQNEKRLEPDTDSTSSGTVDRHTIDNKAKVAIERDKKQRTKEIEAREFEELRQD